MTKEKAKIIVENIINSHKEEIQQILNEGLRVTIICKPEESPEINITKNAKKIPGAGIRILRNGEALDFDSIDALMYVVKEIGCLKFSENQGNSIIVSKDRDPKIKDCDIKKVEDNNGVWYVNTRSGIDQRVKKLNAVFASLDLDWNAERIQKNN